MRDLGGEPSRDVRGGFSREIWVTIQQIERDRENITRTAEGTLKVLETIKED